MFAEIIIDSREKALIDQFNKWNIGEEKPKYKFEQLNVGDIHFYLPGIEDPVIIIERKTTKDLDASIMDKRLREQKFRLDGFKKKAIVIYLIEGFYEINQKSLRLPKSTHLSAIVNTIVRDRMTVYHTSNTASSFDFILKMSKQLFKYKECFNRLPNTICDLNEKLDESAPESKQEHKQPESSYLDTIKSQKKSHIESKLTEIMLIQIPGIGPKAAQAIVDKYKSIYNLCMCYSECQTEEEKEKMLAKLETDSGRDLGASVSSKVYRGIFRV